MRNNTAEDLDYYATQDGALAPGEGGARADGLSYARILRTLGLALEAHRVVTCDIAIENDIYTIKGIARPQAKTRRGLLQSVRKFFVRDDLTPRPDFFTNRIELRYSMAEIRALDAQVRVRRSAAPELADPLSLSQLLRVVGGFMDKRDGEELLGLRIDDRRVTITHVSRDARLLKTTQDIEYFYDLWVKMYLQRSNRLRPAPPSGPTVCVSGTNPARSVGYMR